MTALHGVHSVSSYDQRWPRTNPNSFLHHLPPPRRGAPSALHHRAQPSYYACMQVEDVSSVAQGENPIAECVEADLAKRLLSCHCIEVGVVWHDLLDDGQPRFHRLQNEVTRHGRLIDDGAHDDVSQVERWAFLTRRRWGHERGALNTTQGFSHCLCWAEERRGVTARATLALRASATRRALRVVGLRAAGAYK